MEKIRFFKSGAIDECYVSVRRMPRKTAVKKITVLQKHYETGNSLQEVVGSMIC